MALHWRGIAQRPGRDPSQSLFNAWYGPPALAPLQYTGLGLLGIAAAAPATWLRPVLAHFGWPRLGRLYVASTTPPLWAEVLYLHGRGGYQRRLMFVPVVLLPAVAAASAAGAARDNAAPAHRAGAAALTALGVVGTAGHLCGTARQHGGFSRDAALFNLLTGPHPPLRCRWSAPGWSRSPLSRSGTAEVAVARADHRLTGSDAWDETTRRVVEARLEDAQEFRFFTPAQAHTLKALTTRLLPQDDRASHDRVPVAARIDGLLAAGEIDGYRRGDEPWPEDWWQVGLAALDATASSGLGAPFADLAPGDAEDIIAAAADGAVPEELWQQLPAPTFIAGAVDQVVSVYYADPRAWSEIGWAGPANPRGYLRTGYGRRDPWEPADPGTRSARRDPTAARTLGGDRDSRDREVTH